jgi:hypothetical protein
MLNQTTYRLWLRNAINETGLADGPAIDAAIALLAINVIPVTPNPVDQQD